MAQKGQRTELKLINQRNFLRAYRKLATITHAAKAADIAMQTHYDWMKDPAYRKKFLEAEEVAKDAMVAEARRRAVDGTEEPVFYQGKEVGSIRRYSDGLLMFLLKGEMPEKYRERYEVSGGGKPIQFAGYDPARLSELSNEQLQQLESVLRLLAAPPGDPAGTPAPGPPED